MIDGGGSYSTPKLYITCPICFLVKVLGHKRYAALGWSDGANTAMILAAQNTEAVEKLVVWGGNAYCTDADIKMYEGM